MKIKKDILSKAICSLILVSSITTPVLASSYNYEFSSDTDEVFGNPTFTSDDSYYNNNENVRKDKNYAQNPPTSGLFSGVYETGSSNLYMPELDNSSADNVTNALPSDEYTNTGELLPDTSLVNGDYTSNNSNGDNVIVSNGLQTEALEYTDGSIGTLYFKDYGKTMKVYEGETLANLRLGVGHFHNTSAWDGNVAIAGHNRGSYGYFSMLKNMDRGDEVVYTTKYGTRTYEMTDRIKIDVDDMSYFNYSDDNILTLVTCVENEPEYRYVVRLEEE